MSLPQLLTDYGYWAVFVGSLLEGETILILAGFAAHRGYLSLPLVMCTLPSFVLLAVAPLLFAALSSLHR